MGCTDGRVDGKSEGRLDGPPLGPKDGDKDGIEEGAAEGTLLGTEEGALETDGAALGLAVVGALVGLPAVTVGADVVGQADGLPGVTVGAKVKDPAPVEVAEISWLNRVTKISLFGGYPKNSVDAGFMDTTEKLTVVPVCNLRPPWTSISDTLTSLGVQLSLGTSA